MLILSKKLWQRGSDVVKNYRIIDLCAGIGGIRKGFELAGNFENVFSVETTNKRTTYEANFGETPKEMLRIPRYVT